MSRRRNGAGAADESVRRRVVNKRRRVFSADFLDLTDQHTSYYKNFASGAAVDFARIKDELDINSFSGKLSNLLATRGGKRQEVVAFLKGVVKDSSGRFRSKDGLEEYVAEIYQYAVSEVLGVKTARNIYGADSSVKSGLLDLADAAFSEKKSPLFSVASDSKELTFSEKVKKITHLYAVKEFLLEIANEFLNSKKNPEITTDISQKYGPKKTFDQKEPRETFDFEENILRPVRSELDQMIVVNRRQVEIYQQKKQYVESLNAKGAGSVAESRVLSPLSDGGASTADDILSTSSGDSSDEIEQKNELLAQAILDAIVLKVSSLKRSGTLILGNDDIIVKNSATFEDAKKAIIINNIKAKISEISGAAKDFAHIERSVKAFYKGEGGPKFFATSVIRSSAQFLFADNSNEFNSAIESTLSYKRIKTLDKEKSDRQKAEKKDVDARQKSFKRRQKDMAIVMMPRPAKEPSIHVPDEVSQVIQNAKDQDLPSRTQVYFIDSVLNDVKKREEKSSDLRPLTLVALPGMGKTHSVNKHIIPTLEEKGYVVKKVNLASSDGQIKEIFNKEDGFEGRVAIIIDEFQWLLKFRRHVFKELFEGYSRKTAIQRRYGEFQSSNPLLFEDLCLARYVEERSNELAKTCLFAKVGATISVEAERRKAQQISDAEEKQQVELMLKESEVERNKTLGIISGAPKVFDYKVDNFAQILGGKEEKKGNKLFYLFPDREDMYFSISDAAFNTSKFSEPAVVGLDDSNEFFSKEILKDYVKKNQQEAIIFPIILTSDTRGVKTQEVVFGAFYYNKSSQKPEFKIFKNTQELSDNITSEGKKLKCHYVFNGNNVVGGDYGEDASDPDHVSVFYGKYGFEQVEEDGAKVLMEGGIGYSTEDFRQMFGRPRTKLTDSSEISAEEYVKKYDLELYFAGGVSAEGDKMPQKKISLDSQDKLAANDNLSIVQKIYQKSLEEESVAEAAAIENDRDAAQYVRDNIVGTTTQDADYSAFNALPTSPVQASTPRQGRDYAGSSLPSPSPQTSELSRADFQQKHAEIVDTFLNFIKNIESSGSDAHKISLFKTICNKLYCISGNNYEAVKSNENFVQAQEAFDNKEESFDGKGELQKILQNVKESFSSPKERTNAQRLNGSGDLNQFHL